MVNSRFLAMLLAVVVAACSTAPATPVGGSATRVKPAKPAPVFTEQEKTVMTHDEKAAIYNASVEDDEKVTCKREQITGSRMSQTICKTEAERQQDRENARETLHDVGFESFVCDPELDPTC